MVQADRTCERLNTPFLMELPVSDLIEILETFRTRRPFHPLTLSKADSMKD